MKKILNLKEKTPWYLTPNYYDTNGQWIGAKAEKSRFIATKNPIFGVKWQKTIKNYYLDDRFDIVLTALSRIEKYEKALSKVNFATTFKYRAELRHALKNNYETLANYIPSGLFPKEKAVANYYYNNHAEREAIAILAALEDHCYIISDLDTLEEIELAVYIEHWYHRDIFSAYEKYDQQVKWARFGKERAEEDIARLTLAELGV